MVTLIRRLTTDLKLSNDLKIPRKLQAYFLKTLAELLQEGFSINQSLAFLSVLMNKQANSLRFILSHLEAGESFESSLLDLGFSYSVVAQLFYAQRQGRFIAALHGIAQQLTISFSYRQKLLKVLAYPLLLSIGLVAMLFAMRLFILPQITSFITQETYDKESLVRLLIGFFSYLPHIVITTLATAIILYGVVDHYLLKQTELVRYTLLVKVKPIRKWVRAYSSYKLAAELAHFFAGGYSMQQTIAVMLQYPIDPFLTEIAHRIHLGMLDGQGLAEIITSLDIFTEDFPLVIIQGELTQQTAQKCLLYANKCYTDLMEDVERKLNWVQPILFIIIGFMVMAMYLLLMLPTLTMEGI